MKPELKYQIVNNELNITDVPILPKFTTIIGKNNSGKSWLLKSIFSKLDNEVDPRSVYYMSPERFGALERNSAIEDASFSKTRERDRLKLKNQSNDFITEAISKFNALVGQLNRTNSDINEQIKLGFLESLNGKVPDINFTYTSSSESTPFNFKINNKHIDPNIDKFSSGTNQVIALMTSVMYFLHSGKYTDDAVLLLDEPDVHIHPDLQVGFINFLVQSIKDTQHKVIIATHSSSIISGFINVASSYIAIRDDSTLQLKFYEINKYLEKLLPSLGSHSLSHVFNSSPLLLVEGEDDELVWQYAIRNSKDRRINFHIINTTSVSEMTKYEHLVNDIADKIFDRPKVFEIRDRDTATTSLPNNGLINRSYLDCHEIENLILSNQVIVDLGYNNYSEVLSHLKLKFTDCHLISNPKHNLIKCKVCKVISDLSSDSFDRFTADLKGSENRIISKLKPDNNLSWEIIVGKSIGKYLDKKEILLAEEGSIYNMLGRKITDWL